MWPLYAVTAVASGLAAVDRPARSAMVPNLAVSGGLACIAGARLVVRMLPAFSHYRADEPSLRLL